jgi:hypothetical protein
MIMSNEETDTQPEKKVQTDEPMSLMDRAAHYASPGVPKKGKGRFKKFKPTVHNDDTPAQRRRLRHKENHAIAVQVREAEAKVARLRGATKKSAQAKLDKLKAAFK